MTDDPNAFDMPPEPDPATAAADEAEYWLAFYEELIAVERRALDRMRELSGRVTDEVRAEVERTNIQPLESMIEELEDRNTRWQQRMDELTA